MGATERLEALDLIGERHLAEAALDGSLPVPAAAGRPAVVDRYDDGVHPIGEPLRQQVIALVGLDGERVGTAVHVQNDWVAAGTIGGARADQRGVEWTRGRQLEVHTE